MPVNAGSLRYRAWLEKQVPSDDGWGGESHVWVPGDRPISVSVKAPSGLSAARAALSSGVPTATVQYSVRMRRRSFQAQQPGPGMRFQIQGLHYYVVGSAIAHDDPTFVDVVCSMEEHTDGR